MLTSGSRAQVLKALPQAQLHLKKPEFNDESVRQVYLKRFQSMGIETSRIKLFGRTSQKEHFSFYSQLDFALDPFPYNGGITSCEVLWMGVPILTLRDGVQSTVSILANLGLDEWIAEDKSDFLDKAVHYSLHTESLMTLRQSLRERLVNSIICDGANFARQIKVNTARWPR